MIIIIVLKTYSSVELGHWLRTGSRVGLTRVSVRIKIIVIIVLKFDLGVNLRQGSSHKWG